MAIPSDLKFIFGNYFLKNLVRVLVFKRYNCRNYHAAIITGAAGRNKEKQRTHFFYTKYVMQDQKQLHRLSTKMVSKMDFLRKV